MDHAINTNHVKFSLQTSLPNHSKNGTFRIIVLKVDTGQYRGVEEKIMSGQERRIAGQGRGVFGPEKRRRGWGRRERRMSDGVQRRVRAVITDEIRATTVDQVINLDLSLREASERVQPNLRYLLISNQISRNPQVSNAFHRAFFYHY